MKTLTQKIYEWLDWEYPFEDIVEEDSLETSFGVSSILDSTKKPSLVQQSPDTIPDKQKEEKT